MMADQTLTLLNTRNTNVKNVGNILPQVLTCQDTSKLTNLSMMKMPSPALNSFFCLEYLVIINQDKCSAIGSSGHDSPSLVDVTWGY